MNDWQAVSAARLTFIVAECLPEVVPSKGSIDPLKVGRSAALPRQPLENKATQQHQRGVAGSGAAICTRTRPKPRARTIVLD